MSWITKWTKATAERTVRVQEFVPDPPKPETPPRYEHPRHDESCLIDKSQPLYTLIIAGFYRIPLCENCIKTGRETVFKLVELRAL